MDDATPQPQTCASGREPMCQLHVGESQSVTCGVSPNPPDYITVTSGLRGFFCVYVVWETYDTGDGRYAGYEPFLTSPISHDTREAAEVEAREWADAEGVEFR